MATLQQSKNPEPDLPVTRGIPAYPNPGMWDSSPVDLAPVSGWVSFRTLCQNPLCPSPSFNPYPFLAPTTPTFKIYVCPSCTVTQDTPTGSYPVPLPYFSGSFVHGPTTRSPRGPRRHSGRVTVSLSPRPPTVPTNVTLVPNQTLLRGRKVKLPPRRTLSFVRSSPYKCRVGGWVSVGSKVTCTGVLPRSGDQ